MWNVKSEEWLYQGVLHFVLIETLWNVKSEKYRIYETESYVLIETLWNVKPLFHGRYGKRSEVLIETLWNVKTHIFHFSFLLEFRINRNIVECKVISIAAVPASGNAY